ncbi:hypothetical protein D9757_007354 [Collybiopsis confluens]|uniref:Uncharacterized protein n=1 Tax=Collybiopsis confluens TaxID=2823264 RepID=A0A8H5HIN2_9AGAR|nr:hypothetical protein D9757_007354 [Collybiopsis confluens]
MKTDVARKYMDRYRSFWSTTEQFCPRISFQATYALRTSSIASFGESSLAHWSSKTIEGLLPLIRRLHKASGNGTKFVDKTVPTGLLKTTSPILILFFLIMGNTPGSREAQRYQPYHSSPTSRKHSDSSGVSLSSGDLIDQLADSDFLLQSPPVPARPATSRTLTKAMGSSLTHAKFPVELTDSEDEAAGSSHSALTLAKFPIKLTDSEDESSPTPTPAPTPTKAAGSSSSPFTPAKSPSSLRGQRQERRRRWQKLPEIFFGLQDLPRAPPTPPHTPQKQSRSSGRGGGGGGGPPSSPSRYLINLRKKKWSSGANKIAGIQGAIHIIGRSLARKTSIGPMPSTSIPSLGRKYFCLSESEIDTVPCIEFYNKNTERQPGRSYNLSRKCAYLA